MQFLFLIDTFSADVFCLSSFAVVNNVSMNILTNYVCCLFFGLVLSSFLHLLLLIIIIKYLHLTYDLKAIHDLRTTLFSHYFSFPNVFSKPLPELTSLCVHCCEGLDVLVCLFHVHSYADLPFGVR